MDERTKSLPEYYEVLRQESKKELDTVEALNYCEVGRSGGDGEKAVRAVIMVASLLVILLYKKRSNKEYSLVRKKSYSNEHGEKQGRI